MAPLTDRQRQIASLWLRGVSSEGIAATVGLKSAAGVRSAAKRIGLPPRPQGAIGSNGVDLFPCIVAWARAGYAPEEIARGIGCTDPERFARVR
jgi:hypothetical protein